MAKLADRAKAKYGRNMTETKKYELMRNQV
jgi:hypothetical protein